jgi:hypothetical protein
VEYPKIAERLMQELSKAFVADKRDDGTEYVRLKDGHPEWMLAVVFAAHNDMLPDDWRHKMIERAVSTLSGINPDCWEDETGEIADSLVDIYNWPRLQWLASHLDRAAYCDQALEEGAVDEKAGMFQRIGMGQYEEYYEIVSTLIREVEKLADEEGEDSSLDEDDEDGEAE